MKGLLFLLACTLLGAPASAQYLYLDTDGSGLPSAQTSLRVGQDCSIDLWLITDKGRDGEAGICTGQGRNTVTFFSYEFILRAEGGEVEWKGYKNAISAFTKKLLELHSTTDFYAAYAGVKSLPPGKYRLGQVIVRGLSGEPRLRFAQRTAMSSALGTSFGSDYKGRDADYTLKYAEDARAIGAPGSQPGDWSDADGVGVTAMALTRQFGRTDSLRFRVRVLSGTRSEGVRLAIWTPSSGRIVARLFDVRGRLVRTLLDNPAAAPGEYDVPVVRNGSDRQRIASSVYFYRVEAPDGERSGRVVVLR